MADSADVLQELRDRELIRDLVMRYAHGVDRRDLDLVASCFAPDAGYEGRLGVGTIAIALDALRERMPRYQTTMHFMANHLVELHGNRASSETYAIVYHRLEPDADGDTQDYVVGVRYLDELARHDDGWWIVHRTARLDFQRYDAVVLPPS